MWHVLNTHMFVFHVFGERQLMGLNHHINHLGGGNSNMFYFHHYLVKISNLTNIFQMG